MDLEKLLGRELSLHDVGQLVRDFNKLNDVLNPEALKIGRSSRHIVTDFEAWLNFVREFASSKSLERDGREMKRTDIEAAFGPENMRGYFVAGVTPVYAVMKELEIWDLAKG